MKYDAAEYWSKTKNLERCKVNIRCNLSMKYQASINSKNYTHPTSYLFSSNTQMKKLPKIGVTVNPPY